MNIEELLSMTQAADKMSQLTCDKWYRQKVYTYWKRGKFPDPDQYVGGKPHWLTKTIELYAKDGIRSNLDPSTSRRI